MMIVIKTIPHKKQRYETCGDWQNINGIMQVKVSDCGNESSELAVALHEIIEQHLCKLSGVSEKKVDAFDLKWDQENEDNVNDEPGNDPRAPYYAEHKTAMQIERIFIKACGEKWSEHDKRLGALFE